MDWFRIYLSFINGLFTFLTLELFVTYKDSFIKFREKHILRIVYLVFTFLYALPTALPFGTLIYLLMSFIYIFFLTSYHMKQSLLLFAKYEFYFYLTTSVLFIGHSIVLQDFDFVTTNFLYYNYKSLICTALTYIILCLYTNGKKLSELHAHGSYRLYLNSAIVLSSIVLSYMSLLFVSNKIDITTSLPIIFSLVFIIIAICLSVYNKIVASIKYESQQDLLLKKYELENSYYQNVETSLHTLSSLRHDFKNHLIVLDGYAKKNETDSIRTYIKNLNVTIAQHQLIQTPNNLISAILNTKSAVCQQSQILFTCKHSFSYISINDFYLITILGNILDNAITAAQGLPDGFISISILQIKTCLEIQCTNNHHETIREKNGVFESTKQNTNTFHGIGLKNVQSAISSLNGTLNIHYDTSTFSITILLPAYH